MDANNQQITTAPADAAGITEEDIMRRVRLLNKRESNLDRREESLHARETAVADRENTCNLREHRLDRDESALEYSKVVNNSHAQICNEACDDIKRVQDQQALRKHTLNMLHEKVTRERDLLDDFFTPENEQKIRKRLGRDPTFKEIHEAFKKTIEQLDDEQKDEAEPDCSNSSNNGGSAAWSLRYSAYGTID